MGHIDDYYKAKRTADGAERHLNLIGKNSVSATAKHRGCLYDVRITTTIHYQPSDGATNYHVNTDFDFALAEVIKSKFASLSSDALSLMRRKQSEAAFAAADDLRRLQDEFQEITTQKTGAA